jgi:hypothetical protein
VEADVPVDTSGPAGTEGIGLHSPRSFDGVSIWTWVSEKYLRDDIAERLREGRLDRDDPLWGAQVLFRPGLKPVVRLNREVRGHQVVEGRSVPPTSGDSPGSNVFGFELPQEEAGSGHITAFIVASEIHITFHGADTDSITHEMDGATHYIAAAERLLGDPTVPDDPLYEAFADNAHTAAEMVARAELRRLPDHLPFRKHGQVSSRYHEWAKLENTEMHFPKVLDSTFDWQRRAKYDRSEFSLTPAEAMTCMKALHAMYHHASQRPREATSFPAQDRFDLIPNQ